MKQTEDEEVLIRYLLGSLPDEEQARVEGRLFADDEYYAQLQALKAELTDDYVRGALPPGERQRFENRFMAGAPAKRQARFAASLAQVLAAENPAPGVEKTPLWQSLRGFLRTRTLAIQFSLAVAICALSLGLLWMASENRRLNAQLGNLQAARQADRDRETELQSEAADQRARNDELAEQLRQAQEDLSTGRDQVGTPQPSLPARMVAFALAPGLVRGGDKLASVDIPQDATLLRFQLGLEGEEDYTKYRVEVRTAGGNLVWSKDGLSPGPGRPGAVAFTIPARLLAAGNYEIALKGIVGGRLEDVAYYYVAAKRR